MNEEANTNTARVPSTWPGAFGLYKYSKRAVKENLWVLVLVGLVGFAVNVVLRLLLRQQLGTLASYVIGALQTAATTIIFLASIRGQKVSLEQSIKQAVPFWLNMFLLNILVFFAIVGSLLAFVIPFFFVFPRLLLANYFLIDKKMDPVDAFKASWNATKGQGVKVWGIIGASIVMFLPVFTIVGAPFAVYFLIMYSAALPILYVFLSKKPAQPVVAEVPAATTN